jgi:nicotinamidase-related amidase
MKGRGEHAMADMEGAAIIPELVTADGDFALPKRFYSSFHETGLDPLLHSYQAAP